MTAALEGGEVSAAHPGSTLPPGKSRYPLYRRLGGPQGRSGWAENFAPRGFDPRTVQPVVSRYTDWATWPKLVYRLSCLLFARTEFQIFTRRLAEIFDILRGFPRSPRKKRQTILQMMSWLIICTFLPIHHSKHGHHEMLHNQIQLKETTNT